MSVVACSDIGDNNNNEFQDVDGNELVGVVVPILDLIKGTILDVGGPLEVPPEK